MERLAIRPAADRALWVLGEVITVLARNPGYTLIESAALPGEGMPPHIHHFQDEAICVVEGEYILARGGEETKLLRGSFAFVDRGTVHVLNAAGDEPGRTLVILTPPGSLERFFEEVGVPLTDTLAPTKELPSEDEAVRIARRHGTEFLTRPV